MQVSACKSVKGYFLVIRDVAFSWVKVTREHRTAQVRLMDACLLILETSSLCWQHKGDLKGNVKEDSEVALQILTESFSQAGMDKYGPQRFQTRTIIGSVVALLVVAKHQQNSDSTDHYTIGITPEWCQCSTRDRGRRSPKRRLGNRSLQNFPHLGAVNVWDDVSRWICSVCT